MNDMDEMQARLLNGMRQERERLDAIAAHYNEEARRTNRHSMYLLAAAGVIITLAAVIVLSA